MYALFVGLSWSTAVNIVSLRAFGVNTPILGTDDPPQTGHGGPDP